MSDTRGELASMVMELGASPFATTALIEKPALDEAMRRRWAEAAPGVRPVHRGFENKLAAKRGSGNRPQ